MDLELIQTKSHSFSLTPSLSLSLSLSLSFSLSVRQTPLHIQEYVQNVGSVVDQLKLPVIIECETPV